MTAILVTVLMAAPSEGDWPGFLAPREAYHPDVVAGVERVWLEPTLHRSVRGKPITVPFGLYVALFDAPEITAGAARILGRARYQVRVLDDDWYEADDDEGARGVYRVLLRTPHRRIILSWGEHRGSVLGTIAGSALTVLDVREHVGGVEPSLSAHVRIDHPVAAQLARLLLPVFGGVADRKLAAGFAVTAAVAQWAVARPEEFCAWLRQESFSRERRDRIAAHLGNCASAGPGRTPSAS